MRDQQNGVRDRWNGVALASLLPPDFDSQNGRKRDKDYKKDVHDPKPWLMIIGCYGE